MKIRRPKILKGGIIISPVLSLSNANYNEDFLREPWLLETRRVLGNRKNIEHFQEFSFSKCLENISPWWKNSFWSGFFKMTRYTYPVCKNNHLNSPQAKQPITARHRVRYIGEKTCILLDSVAFSQRPHTVVLLLFTSYGSTFWKNIQK